MHKQIRSPILGDFITKIVEACQDEGYTFSEHEVYRLGREYIADLRIVEVTATFSTEAVKESVEGKPEAVEGTIDDKVIPDWEKLDELVAEGDKDAIEDYCKPFGIDLNKRKSPQNMIKEFKLHVGA